MANDETYLLIVGFDLINLIVSNKKNMIRARPLQYAILILYSSLHTCEGFGKAARPWLSGKASIDRETRSSIESTFHAVKGSFSHESPLSNNRRGFIKTLSYILPSVLTPSSCWALIIDDTQKTVGESITEVVTQSDIGISVRRSVVRGAQIMDQLDKKWEQLSDNFHLGAQRSQREDRPKPKVIPPRRPLNSILAKRILILSDETFLSILPVSTAELANMIDKVDSIVKKSFVRSGLVPGSLKDTIGFENFSEMNGDLFNYYSYIHFKAYCQLLLNSNVRFQSIRTKFEELMGLKLIDLFYTNGSIPTIETSLDDRLQTSFDAIDYILEKLRNNGFIASSERSVVESDQIEDWIDGIASCSFTIALDGDSTLQGQILLQEQGFKLYPSFFKFLMSSLLRKIFQDSSQTVSIEEYYMDTNYNSDPDLFDAKQVLLNVVIEES